MQTVQNDKFYLFNCVGELVSSPKGCSHKYLLKAMKNRKHTLYVKIWDTYNKNWYAFNNNNNNENENTVFTCESNSNLVWEIKSGCEIKKQNFSDTIQAKKQEKAKKIILYVQPNYMNML